MEDGDLMTSTSRDHDLAKIANHHGAHYSLRIIIEARRTQIPISLGLALVEQESSFTNVFGGDPTIFANAGQVTEARYRAYKAKRGTHGQGGMQGIGPTQLTWWEYQDRADKLGGCWKPACNIRVGFEVLADLIKEHGEAAGVARYNGSGDAALKYQGQVYLKRDHWHDRLVA